LRVRQEIIRVDATLYQYQRALSSISWNGLTYFPLFKLGFYHRKWRHDTRITTLRITLNKMWHSARGEFCYAEYLICWVSFILSAFMLNVIMLSVMVPPKELCTIESWDQSIPPQWNKGRSDRKWQDNKRSSLLWNRIPYSRKKFWRAGLWIIFKIWKFEIKGGSKTFEKLQLRENGTTSFGQLDKMASRLRSSWSEWNMQNWKFARKELLSRINRFYNWRLICKTHEHYNYL